MVAGVSFGGSFTFGYTSENNFSEYNSINHSLNISVPFISFATSWLESGLYSIRVGLNLGNGIPISVDTYRPPLNLLSTTNGNPDTPHVYTSLGPLTAPPPGYMDQVPVGWTDPAAVTATGIFNINGVTTTVNAYSDGNNTIVNADQSHVQTGSWIPHTQSVTIVQDANGNAFVCNEDKCTPAPS